MCVKLVLAMIVFCAVVLKTNSEKNYDGRPFMQQGYIRIKRGKYNSSPQRFYSRPPMSRPIRGPFSYTPPPNYMADDDESPYQRPLGFISRPPKVSKRPSDEGLEEHDINNIVKHLSKKDLDKIIDLAGGSNRDSNAYSKGSFERHIKFTKPSGDSLRSSELQLDKYSLKPIGDDDSSNKLFKALVEQIDIDTQHKQPYEEPKPFNVEYKNTIQESQPFFGYNNFVTQPTQQQSHYTDTLKNNLYNSAALAAEESMLQRQIAYLKSQINDGVVYTDSKVMPEETLPKPMNLREEQDYDVSYTNNVATVVKADQSNSYKLENFGDLPLMNYNSKLDTVSSYHVPHYTVTSQSKPLSSYSAPSYSPPSAYGPKVEPAPPASVAKAESDAHLKAVRIWSHRSKGTAYTLHDDGSLSLEKPGRPRGRYGNP